MKAGFSIGCYVVRFIIILRLGSADRFLHIPSSKSNVNYVNSITRIGLAGTLLAALVTDNHLHSKALNTLSLPPLVGRMADPHYTLPP